MEQLKQQLLQQYAKLKDLYLSMTLGNRIVATMLAATLLLSLGYLIVGSVQRADPNSRTVRLYNGHEFNRNDQRAAEHALANANLRGHQWVGDQLQVPADRQHLYVAALAAANVVPDIGTARELAVRTLNPWQNARMMDKVMITAKERDSVAAIKMLPGIADAKVFTNRRPAWERNVWARTHVMSVGVFVEAVENRPLNADTIGAIGGIIRASFGITDLKEINIVDARNNLKYDGSGERIDRAPRQSERCECYIAMKNEKKT